MFSPDTAQAVGVLLQDLVAMMPRRWASIRIDIERDVDDDFVRLVNLNTQLGPGAGAMPPALGRDQATIVESMNDVLGDIDDDMGEMWLGLAARLERTPDGSAHLVLLGRDESEQSRLTLTPDVVEGLTLSDELFDALDSTRQQAHVTQGAFQQAIQGFRQWNLVQDRAELSFVLADGRTWAMRGQALGSWSREDESWKWAWDNASIHPACGGSSSRARDSARGRRGLAALTTGTFDATQALAVELALHAGAVIGARGVFPGDYGAGVAYIAAME